jgi:hypothetical protein
MGGEQPRVVALVMCKKATAEVGSMVYTLNGVFSTLRFSEFPATYEYMDVFVEFESKSGLDPINVTLHSGNEFQRCLVHPQWTYGDGRPSYIATFREARFPRPGEYHVSVFDSTNSIVAERKLHVIGGQ